MITMCQQNDNETTTAPEIQPQPDTKLVMESQSSVKQEIKQEVQEAKLVKQDFEYYDEEYASYESEEEKK